jgi:hypothetical protein
MNASFAAHQRIHGATVISERCHQSGSQRIHRNTKRQISGSFDLGDRDETPRARRCQKSCADRAVRLVDGLS